MTTRFCRIQAVYGRNAVVCDGIKGYNVLLLAIQWKNSGNSCLPTALKQQLCFQITAEKSIAV